MESVAIGGTYLTQREGQPQYSVQLRNWKHGLFAKIGEGSFSFKNKTDAAKVDIAELQSDLPQHFTSGGE